MESHEAIEKIIPLLGFPERFKEIESHLTENSNLPGPRGNLTLAFKFAESFETEAVSNELVDLLVKWVNLSPEEAPTNHPGEYLSFCGILCLGSHYCFADESRKELIMDQFKTAMNDIRWRVKEGAAMGFQKIAERDFEPIKKFFLQWYEGSTYAEKRAFIAALAHPPILADKEIARFSLKISGDILDEVLKTDKTARKSEEFKVLSKGLQYALSVFTAYLPEEGFELLKKYAKINDPELKKIIKSNLGKSRLAKPFASNVAEVAALLS
ncbi:MAG: hypothetical protein LBQ71_07705 [Hungatella sp.]|jgi:hypothetical protein|nr:hypothetical protein [Hungatella sp.]